MQAKGAFLKRMLNLKSIKLFFIFVFFSLPLASKENITLNSALNYLNNLNEFSSSFLQIQNNDISEGLIFIKGDRLRIEYTSPSNIIFILKKNKGMYFNTELQEVQYFNPKKTIGKFFIDLFNNNKFLSDSKITNKKGYFYIQNEIQLDEITYGIKIYFEEKPLQLRKLEIINELEIINFTILNPNYNPNLNDKFFSLANPLLS